MAQTRQLRINDISKIKERIAQFTDKKITLVLHDGRVTTGMMKTRMADGVTLLNFRNKVMTFRFNDVAELYFDTLE
jgi:hypothetical protein